MTLSKSRNEVSRVLIVGERAESFAIIAEELRQLCLEVSSVDVGGARRAMDGAFDLICLSQDIAHSERRRLQQQLRSCSPDIRIVSAYAPYAASQILSAFEGAETSHAVDLDQYCERIGYRGRLDPTIGTLRELQEQHIAAIPFEAIDVMLGRGIDIAPRAVDAKLLAAGRGGYCYEQNGLFKRVLETIGFEVDALVASVCWQAQPGSAPNPYTHMALRVLVEDVPWLVDVGFGASVPPAPLRLDAGGEQSTRHEIFRVVPLGLGTLAQARINDQWQSLYRLSPEPVLDSHFELCNWFTSTHPGSHFRQELAVAKATTTARYALRGNRLTVRFTDGRMERRHLAPDEFAPVLQDIFQLRADASWTRLWAAPGDTDRSDQ